MSACEVCGRTEADGGGHWMGCEVVAAVKENHRLQNVPDEELASAARPCAVDGCMNAVFGDKRVKYCEDHKDPKSRKE